MIQRRPSNHPAKLHVPCLQAVISTMAVLCAGAKDPKALETLVKSMNVKTESVNRDLTSYKGILSKLSAAKELMAELMAREKRKQEERYGDAMLRCCFKAYAAAVQRLVYYQGM